MLDGALFRYSVKVGGSVVIAYLIGILSQRPELSTILTTVLITALPTYGAALRKMVLRIIGAAAATPSGSRRHSRACARWSSLIHRGNNQSDQGQSVADAMGVKQNNLERFERVTFQELRDAQA